MSQQQSITVKNSLIIEKNREFIRKSLIEDRTVQWIADQLEINVHHLSRKYLNTIASNLVLHRARLGHKDEPYYLTEDEMLNEVEYNYNTLSDDEKEIYNKRQEVSEPSGDNAGDDGFYGGPSNYLSCGL